VEIWELVARESVRDLVARYNSHGDAGRLDELLTGFTEDAVMDMDGDVSSGIDGIREAFRDAGRSFVAHAKASGMRREDGPVLRHLTATLVIRIESQESATSSCYFFVLMKQGLDHWGSYHDTFRNVDGTWLISHRKVIVEGTTPGSFGEAAAARKAAAAST
jgi:ketosteroid isomerase-like protein